MYYNIIISNNIGIIHFNNFQPGFGSSTRAFFHFKNQLFIAGIMHVILQQIAKNNFFYKK